ncbi:putative LRR receptor-like serine/threonine-protein kinase-like [Capsicum annuum]|uniref:protein JASON n=1 Tax=Capsicum annuum TaxID=4072 RepID=UPI001FB05943|nr:protein JASON [Capsicum annuum]KAF3628061.1 putative LRR receptor-like serine/threonine-protein kinase-like [Capsicum annuum]
MGCLLGCFGGDKDKKRRKNRKKVIPRDQKHVCQDPPRSIISTEQSITEDPSGNLLSQAQDRLEEQLSLSARKKVTFDSKVTTYEPVLSMYESTDSLPETKKSGEDEREEGYLAKSSQSKSSSEEGSVISSVGSYPTNHRYQNCRDSDDEAEEFGDSDLDEECDPNDDEDYGDSDCEGGEVLSEPVAAASFGSKGGQSFHQVKEQEVDSPTLMFDMPDKEMRKGETNGYVRDRSAYIHPVLNPVENLSQWKSVKSHAAEPLKLLPQKENVAAEVEGPRALFSLEPTFKQSSSSFKPKPKDQDIRVDASLSNWLVTPDNTRKKAGFSVLETVTSEKSMSQSSNSVMSFEDRPILGALTIEELKQHSATSSPRKSPCRSPDEMPIIGTVGTYWNPLGSAKGSGSASSFKGIPNSTSKYREDKRVNWHSTPFEARLDKALQGAAEASLA